MKEQLDLKKLQQADIRLIGIDLDGTMLNDEKKVTERTKKAFFNAMENGILIVPATGRHYCGVPEEVAKIEGIQYVLTTNGAGIYNKQTNACVYEDAMSCEEALELLEQLMKFDILIDAFIGKEAYRDQKDMECVDELDIPQVIKEFIKNSRGGVPSLYNYIKENHLAVQKFTLNFKRDNCGEYIDRKQVIKMAQSFGGLACVSGGVNNFELTKETATKGNALLHLGKLLGIEREQIMAIGDSGNDFEMIKAAGIGVAMANAEKEIFTVADMITKSNQEDGVAYLIEQYLQMKLN